MGSNPNPDHRVHWIYLKQVCSLRDRRQDGSSRQPEAREVIIFLTDRILGFSGVKKHGRWNLSEHRAGEDRTSEDWCFEEIETQCEDQQNIEYEFFKQMILKKTHPGSTKFL